MSKVTKDTVKSIAKLARLGLGEEELAKAAADLTSILNHFSQIQDIDTTDVPTYDDASGLQSVTREDTKQPEQLAAHSGLLDRAPQIEKNQIKVKAVFE